MSRAIKLEQSDQFVLPADIVSRADISHVLREIEKVDYAFEEQAIRTPDKPPVIPAMSRGLVELLTYNSIAVEELDARKALLAELRKIKEHAPVIQLTFANDSDSDVTMQLVAWIREHLHPTALVSIGVQPGIIGGCVVRTPDHVYDFSLRTKFKRQIPELTQLIRGMAVPSA